MRGFVHVVEVIFIFILMFTLLSQIAPYKEYKSYLKHTQLEMIGEDVSEIITRTSKDLLNTSRLESIFNRTGIENIRYNVELQNYLNDEIVVGCICNEQDFSYMKSIVGSEYEEEGYFFRTIHFNGRGINITFWMVEDEDEFFSFKFDVLVIPKYINLSDKIVLINNFLKHGRGIVEIFNAEPFLKNDFIQKNYFMLNISTSNIVGDTMFNDYITFKNNNFHELYNYFLYVPILYDGFENIEKWISYGDVKIKDGYVLLNGSEEPAGIYTKKDFYNKFDGGLVEVNAYVNKSSILLIQLGYDVLSDSSLVAVVSTINDINSSFAYQDGDSLTFVGFNKTYLEEGEKKIVISITNENATLFIDGELIAYYENPQIIGNRIGLKSIKETNISSIYLFTNKNPVFKNMLSFYENVTLSSVGIKNALLYGTRNTCVPATVNMKNNGRLVWISKNESIADHNYKQLVLSAILWAARKDFRSGYDVSNPISYTTIVINVEDFVEIFNYVLRIEYI